MSNSNNSSFKTPEKSSQDQNDQSGSHYSHYQHSSGNIISQLSPIPHVNEANDISFFSRSFLWNKSFKASSFTVPNINHPKKNSFVKYCQYIGLIMFPNRNSKNSKNKETKKFQI